MKKYTILILSILILAASCQNPFAPPVVGPGSFKPIARQVDPDSVLFNFKYAYENRDSIVYANCLDEDFVFNYLDQNEIGQIVTVEIYRDGPGYDLDVTGRIFRSFDEIRLDTWTIQSRSDSIVGIDTLKIRDVVFYLSVKDTDGDRDYQHLEATGRAHFVFKPNAQDSLWRILLWDDRLYQ
jgi:hypothetical protein